MDPVIIALITVGLLMLCILLGVHVGVALAISSLVGIWWTTGNLNIAISLLGETSYRAIMEYIFGVAPLFIMMGLLANLSGASQELYDAANIAFSRVRGGLGMATVAANAIFASITGVSVASAAVFSKIALPQMRRVGYDHRFALGIVSGSSVLGMLIPPSILLILYGIMAEEAIGKLFIAGILPGIVLAIIFSLGIFIMTLLRPDVIGKSAADEDRANKKNSLLVLLKPWAIALLVLLVLGGIYLGFFTPTEAAAIGAFGTFILALAKRRMTLSNFWDTMLETGYANAAICFLIISAQMYSRMLTIAGMPAAMSQYVTSLSLSPLIIIALIVALFIVLGAILDSSSILLVTIPLLIPIVKPLGFDLIWFGIVSVVAVEMGLLTPPFGMVVYAMKAVLVEEASLEDIFRGSFPFLIMILVFLIIVISFPILSTWLPSLM